MAVSVLSTRVYMGGGGGVGCVLVVSVYVDEPSSIPKSTSKRKKTPYMCGDVTHLLLRAHATPTKSIVEVEDEVEETQQQQLHQFRIENLHTHTIDASRWSFIVFFFWGREANTCSCSLIVTATHTRQHSVR